MNVNPLVPFEVLVGDAVDRLKEMPSGSIQTIITSPPYFALRDYLRAGQIGQEATPDEFISRLVRVFREARRVLRDDGTLWINIGDTYSGSGDGKTVNGIKRKCLIGIPWMLAFALRADGWYLRCDVIWEKNNGTPESAHDRPSRSHEYVFLLTKQPKYFYDFEAVREPGVGGPPKGRKATALANRARLAAQAARPTSANHTGGNGGKWAERKECHGGAFVAYNPRGRHRRSVWKIPTSCFDPKSVGITDVDHFAVMPPNLVKPCILAGTSEGGACAECGAPYARHVADYEDLTDTFVPTCVCPPGEPAPCKVLDPFCGSGTVGVVSVQTGRRFIGIDLNTDYARLARARIEHAMKAL